MSSKYDIFEIIPEENEQKKEEADDEEADESFNTMVYKSFQISKLIKYNYLFIFTDFPSIPHSGRHRFRYSIRSS
jgi:hypothetical protein